MKEGPRTQTFKLGFVSCYDLKPIELCAISRGVHGSSWIGLRGFFDPIHHDGSKKIQPNPTHYINLTQLNPTHMGWVEPMSLTNFIIIIIKLSRKKI